MKPLTLTAFLCAILFSSCVTRQYFLSPFQGNNQPYRAMPLVSDSLKSAIYAGGVFTFAGANQQLRDETFSFQGEIHRAHVFRAVQFNYGANFLLGTYNAKSMYDYGYPSGLPYPASAYPGRRSYSGLGAFAGVNLVVPFENGGEWRAIGLESNFQKEFGQYRDFRKNLPDSFATAIHRQDYFHTIGITSNIIKYSPRSGTRVGFKLGVYVATTSTSHTEEFYSYSIIPAYVASTVHLTKNKVTGFMQVNLGTYTANFQAGGSVRLGK